MQIREHTREKRICWHRLAAMVLCLCLLLGLLPAAGYAKSDVAALPAVLTRSGSASVSKLTEKEIVLLLDPTLPPKGTEIFQEPPSFTAPYRAGKLTDAFLEVQLARLNAFRQLGGMPPVSLSAEYTEAIQTGLVLTEAVLDFAVQHGGLPKPPDMDDAFYTLGDAALAASNLGTASYPLDYAVQGIADWFFGDQGNSNLASAGHRWWLLRPSLGQVGFGVTQEEYYRNGIYILDDSASCEDWQFIAWPPSGNFPLGTRSFALAGSDVSPWSVTLNTEIYENPSLQDVTVELTREADGRTCHFSGEYQIPEALDAPYFTVNEAYQSILFRPDRVQNESGAYTVRITGLRYRDGRAAEICYDVHFFQLSDYDQPFRDVPQNQWYASQVRRAYLENAVSGTSEQDRLFSPDQPLTVAQFAALLLNAFYPGEASAAQGTWYEPYMDAAARLHLLDGLQNDMADHELTRSETAQMTANLLGNWGVQAISYADLSALSAAIPDYFDVPAEYRAALGLCWENGIFAGDDSGHFHGDVVLSRAQAAALYCKISDFYQTL